MILSLVTDHADSTVGDLVEEASSRGALWFWSSVLRTACSHVWRDLSASPLHRVGLAFWGLAASVLAGAGLAMPLIMADRFWTPNWEIPLINVLTCTAGPLLAGWAVARRSNGCELPAAFAVSTLNAVFYVLGRHPAVLQVSIGRPDPSVKYAFATLCVHSLFVMAGATVYRLRILAARKDASQRWGRYLGI